MTLNVTVTLVLTTMFLSISTRLPPTAYIKMIDVWLLFNLLKPFIDIIVNTYIENLRDLKRTQKATLDNSMRVSSAWKQVGLAPLAPTYKINNTGGFFDNSEPTENKNVETIDNCKYFLKTIYPLFYLIFLFLFWIIGLTVYYKS